MKFIDPRIDFAFKKIFGSEDAKDVVMIRLGALWEMTADRADLLPVVAWLDRRFPVRNLDAVKRVLWEHGLPLAWIDETGRHVTRIAERTLTHHWKGNLPVGF